MHFFGRETLHIKIGSSSRIVLLGNASTSQLNCGREMLEWHWGGERCQTTQISELTTGLDVAKNLKPDKSLLVPLFLKLLFKICNGRSPLNL